MRAALPFVLTLALATAACGGGETEAPVDADSLAAGHTDTLAPAGSPPAGPVTDATGCLPDTATLSGDGVGALRVGRPVSEVREACEVVRDTTVPGPEGQPSRRLHVLARGDTMTVEVVDDAVWRVTVTGEAVRTDDGLGVGTPVRELASADGAQAHAGEGGAYVLLPTRCGMSFRFAPTGAAPSGGEWTRDALFRLPGDPEVTAVLLTGCPS